MTFCYVSQPNSVVIEVEVDQKANGQECLDKVRKKFNSPGRAIILDRRWFSMYRLYSIYKLL